MNEQPIDLRRTRSRDPRPACARPSPRPRWGTPVRRGSHRQRAAGAQPRNCWRRRRACSCPANDGNQVALRVLTRPGDEGWRGRESHAVWHETGGSAATRACSSARSADRGRFTAESSLPRSSRATTRSIRDHARRGREHDKPARRDRVSAGGVVAHRRDGPASVASPASLDGRGSSMRRPPVTTPRRSSPNRSTSSPYRCRRAWARPVGSMLAGVVT